MSVEKQYNTKNDYPMDDVPDFDFGEDDCQMKEIVEFNFIAKEKLLDNRQTVETKKFIQRPICLTSDCQTQAERALCYLEFVKKWELTCAQCVQYFDRTAQLLIDLHKHYEERMEYLQQFITLIRNANGRFLGYFSSRENIIKDIKRDIIKLSSTQLEQGYLLLHLVETRLRDFQMTVAILAECATVLDTRCDCCGVSARLDEKQEVVECIKRMMSFVYSLQLHRNALKPRLLAMDELSNKSLSTAIESLDAIYHIQQSLYSKE